MQVAQVACSWHFCQTDSKVLQTHDDRLIVTLWCLEAVSASILQTTGGPRSYLQGLAIHLRLGALPSICYELVHSLLCCKVDEAKLPVRLIRLGRRYDHLGYLRSTSMDERCVQHPVAKCCGLTAHFQIESSGSHVDCRLPQNLSSTLVPCRSA